LRSRVFRCEESGSKKVFFATHLRILREKAGMSQQELSDYIRISKITILRIENAKYSVTLDTLVSISNALQISLKSLVDFK